MVVASVVVVVVVVEPVQSYETVFTVVPSKIPVTLSTWTRQVL